MALRGQSGATTTTSVTSIALTYAGANAVVAGDLIVLASCFVTGGAEGTVTDPTGFTAGGSLSPALADQNIDTQTAFLHVAVKIAVSGDAGFQTYTTSCSNAATWAQGMFVFSGRVNSSIAAAFNNQGVTAFSAEGNTPVTFNITGLTALSGDDVLAIVAVGNQFGKGSETFSIAITGYSNALNTTSTANFGTGLLGISNQNVSSGATGTLASTISASGAAVTISPAAFLFSLPAASGDVLFSQAIF